MTENCTGPTSLNERLVQVYYVLLHQGSYAPVTAIPVSNDDPLAERFVGAVTAETVSTEAMPYLEVVAPASLPEVSCTCCA